MRADLQKWKRCAPFVSHALTVKQKKQRLNHTYDLIKTIKGDLNFLDSMITSDESWCFAYDPETKPQSSEWCGPNPLPSKKFQFQKSSVKTMLILFFGNKDVIHHKYVPEAQTVNAMSYVQALDRLCERIARVRPEMWRDWKYFLVHDNMHPHTAAIVRWFLAKKRVAQLSHPPYLPDLSLPPHYFAFPKLK